MALILNDIIMHWAERVNSPILPPLLNMDDQAMMDGLNSPDVLDTDIRFYSPLRDVFIGSSFDSRVIVWAMEEIRW